MMTFNLTLTPQVLSKLTSALSELATDVTYQPGTPGELSIDSSEANKPIIMDILTETLPTVNDVPRWADLAKIQAKRRRQIAT